MSVPTHSAQLGHGYGASLNDQPVRCFQVAPAFKNGTVGPERAAERIHQRHRLREPAGRRRRRIGFGGEAYKSIKERHCDQSRYSKVGRDFPKFANARLAKLGRGCNFGIK